MTAESCLWPGRRVIPSITFQGLAPRLPSLLVNRVLVKEMLIKKAKYELKYRDLHGVVFQSFQGWRGLLVELQVR